MRTSVSKLLGDAKKKMSGYAALLNYRYANLCIKAQPEALLSLKLEDHPIEDLARACNAPDREDQFQIYPLDPSLLMPLVKAIKKVHPEFDIELKQPEWSDDEEDRYILATMPEVNKDRHDALMQGVAVLSDWCDAKMKAVFAVTSAQIPLKLVNAEPEEIDEAKDALKQLNDWHADICKKYRADKEAEIEDAYKHYQEEQAKKQAEKEEQDAAHNGLAGLQMNLDPDDLL